MFTPILVLPIILYAELRGEGKVIDTYIKNHGSVKGLHATSDFYKVPSYYGAPREIRVGFSFSF